MLTVSLKAEDGLPALAGGEQEEYHSSSPQPGGDRHHQRGHGTLQDAIGRGATGTKTQGFTKEVVGSIMSIPENSKSPEKLHV